MENIEQEKCPIDFEEIVRKLFRNRRLFLIWVPAITIATYLFLCTLPRYYKSVVSIAPESESSVSSALDNFGSLAASFGLGSLSKIGNNDAIYSEIYPELIGSRDFLARLMPVEVCTKDSAIHANYYTYLSDLKKKVWWEYITDGIKDMFKSQQPDNYKGDGVMPTFRVTKKQEGLLKYLKKNVVCNVDRKTDILTIEVTDNDPLVAAVIAKATCANLQEFIIEYRTNKSRIDYNYFKKLCEKSRLEYEESREVYARYADANSNAVLTSRRVKLEALGDEMKQKYDLYTTLEASMLAAERKLQENTPVFTIIEDAAVSIKPAGPKRMIISLVMMFLSICGVAAYILFKEKEKPEFKE